MKGEPNDKIIQGTDGTDPFCRTDPDRLGRGASAYALGKGFQSIGAEDNSIVIFSELMDNKSLFLTANCDTIYYMGIVNLSKGPMVIEQPPMGLGTINDMWFSWIIDIGFPGPDRGKGGRYLLVPPAYDGPLPDGARARSNWFGERASRISHVLRKHAQPVYNIKIIGGNFLEDS